MFKPVVDFCLRRGGVCLAMVSLSGVSGCAGPWTYHPAERGFSAALEGSGAYGPVDGYVQTPAGGAPGTTSGKRPTFQELGIDDFVSAEGSLNLGWRAHGLYAGGRLLRLDGDSTLNSGLVSQGTTFPAGTSVKSRVQLDSYRFGYQYRAAWANEGGTLLGLSPAVTWRVLRNLA